MYLAAYCSQTAFDAHKRCIFLMGKMLNLPENWDVDGKERKSQENSNINTTTCFPEIMQPHSQFTYDKKFANYFPQSKLSHKR